MKVSLTKVTTGISVLATGLVMSFGVAATPPASNAMEEVIVRAPMTVERYEAKTNSFSATIKAEIVELKRPVSAADLDLSKAEDIMVLEQRIEAVAMDSCKKLSDMFPLDRSDRRELNRCTRDAIESAMADKQRLIASVQ